MLTKYIETAMQRAIYERIDDGTFFAEIPEIEGLWANAETVKYPPLSGVPL